MSTSHGEPSNLAEDQAELEEMRATIRDLKRATPRTWIASVFFLLIALGTAAVTAKEWLFHYQRSLSSTIGLVIGGLLTALFVAWAKTQMYPSMKNLRGRDMPKGEVERYFRERNEVLARSFAQFNRRDKYLFAAVALGFLLSIVFPETHPIVGMACLSAVAFSLLWLSIFAIARHLENLDPDSWGEPGA